MITIALDTEDRSAVIEYLRTRNACLIEDDGTVCSDPQCPTRTHLVIFDKSNVFSYHDATAGLKAFFPATELWTCDRKLDPVRSSSTYEESDAILFSGGWPIKNSNRYMYGCIDFRSYRLDGTRKPDWLPEEYKLLMRFIKKRTAKYHNGAFPIYLSPSIEENRKQGKLELFA